MDDEIIKIVPYTLEQHAKIHNENLMETGRYMVTKNMSRDEILAEYGHLLTQEQKDIIKQHKP